jgi:serine/threonine protein kinase/Tfp pilus assembly protein PilF
MPSADPLVGKIVSHYRIVQTLGRGGMGIVYRAEDTTLGRHAALKFLPAELANDKFALERLLHEARSAAALSHPNICTIYEIGEHEGWRFIAMELMQGETMKHRLVAGPVELSALLEFGAQIASALEAAHSAGIVHRDIKPANIFITRLGQAKILDFGLAKAIPWPPQMNSAVDLSGQTTIDALDLTGPGVILGTADYMSPEQVRGQHLDARSDLFSLGSVLYEMATGLRPFAHYRGNAIFEAIANHQPVSPATLNPQLPHKLEEIIQKALEKDRSLRYQSAADLRADLQRLKRDCNLTAGANVARRYNVSEVSTTVKQHGPIDSLAVLPLENVSGDPDTEYLSDGIAETLINSLAQLRKIRIVPRGIAFRYRGRTADPLQVGRQLAVRAVLAGRMVQRGDNLTVSAELVDIEREAQLWGGRYDRKMQDLLVLQNELATEISEKLRLRLTGEEKRELAKYKKQNNEAYRLVLRGQHSIVRWSLDGLRAGIGFCHQAIDIDPTYAPAYAWLSAAYAAQSIFGFAVASEAFPRSRSAARKAIDLDGKLAEAHFSLALVLIYHDWDFATAELELKYALEQKPDSPYTYHALSTLRAVQGLIDESIDAAKHAVELEPLSWMLNFYLGFTYYIARRFEEAIVQISKALELDPNNLANYRYLADAYVYANKPKNAVEACQKIGALGRGVMALQLPASATYAKAGETAVARELLEQAERDWKPDGRSSFFIAAAEARLGEKDKAFKWLERAIEERVGLLVYLKVHPMFDELRKDSRFNAIVRRIGIPE